jgi:putative hydrolase of HD superfamily
MLNKTTNSSFHDLINFFQVTGRLKRTSRSGWVEAGIRQPESVADHIFRTAILCMIYADLEGLNQLKLLRMALIHDLPEAITGDLTPSKKTKGSKDREDTAINQLLNLLPRKLREKYLMDWKEYQEGKTRDAKAVRQLEKLEMALQAIEYETAGLTGQNLKRFVKSAEKTVTWPELTKLLSHALEE